MQVNGLKRRSKSNRNSFLDVSNSMKKFKTPFALFVLLAVSISFNSCCKEACLGNIITISLENYRRHEVDTLFFIGYERNSNFVIKRDSVGYFIPNAANDTMKATHAHSVYTDQDWIIKVPSVSKEFRISNYETVTARCSCGNKKYEIVKSFKVNGSTETSTFISLPR